ncbi:MAG: diguanylate cyclase [Casimicrobiaceae bacterium]|nr:diguanylate cyclase [Casimicrobiaceae bacterium]
MKTPPQHKRSTPEVLTGLLERALNCAISGRTQAGFRYAARAERLAKLVGRALERLHAVRLQGTLSRMACQHAAAREFLDEAYAGYARLQHREGLAEVALQRGHMALDLGDYGEATDCFVEGLEEVEQEGLELLKSRLLAGLGIACARVGDHERAESLYRQALALQRALGNLPAIAGTTYCLGELDVLRAASLQERALPVEAALLKRGQERLREAMRLARSAGRTRLFAMCLNRLGHAHRLAGHYATALEFGKQAMQVFRSLPAPIDLCEAELQLARAYLAGQELELALRHAQSALRGAERFGFRPAERNAHVLLADCFEAINQPGQALQHLKRARAIELELRTSEVLRRIDHHDHQQALRLSEAKAAALSIRAEELSRLAVTDPLTGLLNRRGFEQQLNASGIDRPATVLLFDLDRFKRLNDAFGHAVGDRVLMRVARVISQCCRSTDLAARWGGEEFLLLLYNTTLAQGYEFAERLRLQLQRINWSEIGLPESVTLSVGIAERQKDEAVASLIERADHALYLAKASGRNRCVAAAIPASHPDIVPRSQNSTTVST